MISRPIARQFIQLGILAYVCVLAQSASCQANQETDPAEGLASKLWTADRKASLIAVQGRVMSANGFVPEYGTAFMISDDYALTAAHVVCNLDGSPANEVTLSIGGPGGTQISPIDTTCSLSGRDAALMRVPSLTNGRKHLDPGIPEDIVSNHFVTTYGFGSTQTGGRYLKGNAQDKLNKESYSLTDLGAAPGDSGAPVVDQSGGVIGILLAGQAVGTTAYVSLRQIDPQLDMRSIFVPRPSVPVAIPIPDQVGSQTISTLTPALGLRLSGTVNVQLGRLPDGTWPSPSVRPANRGEADVVVAFDGWDQFIPADFGSDGNWSLPVPIAMPANGIGYTATVDSTVEDVNLSGQRKYWSDPKRGWIQTANQNPQESLTIYTRSAYVAYELRMANVSAQTVVASSGWPDCWTAAISPTIAASGICTADVVGNIQRKVTSTDEFYHHAFVASAIDQSDISITTSIAASWANFRLTANNACRATQVMESLFGKFQTDTLSGPLIAQTLNMIVGCQQMPEGAAGVMDWRTGGETRQEAGVRLISQTLARFARNPAQLNQQRGTIVSDVSTALESYKEGEVKTVDAAAVVANSSVLSEFLTTFMNRYATVLCKSKSVRLDGVPSTVRALNELKQLVSTCS